jgi:hypothetical protein
MLTTAQATAAGVARSTLLRREQGGSLERIRHGVYRLAGSPSDPLDDIRAAWLASNPSALARERRSIPDVVVGGAAAATAHRMGDLYPTPYRLYTPTRRRSTQDDVHYTTRSIPNEDVTILEGLPVTTRERTLADLLNEDGADLSLVADALRDAELSNIDLDTKTLIRHLDSIAAGLGYEDGTVLYQELRSLAGVDAKRVQDLLVHTDLQEQMNAAVEERLRQMLAPMQAQLDAQLRRTIEPLLRANRIAMPALKLPDVALPTIKMPTFKAPQMKMPTITLPPGLLPPPPLSQSTIDLFDRLTKTSAKYAGTARSAPASADAAEDHLPDDEDPTKP